MNVPAIYYRKSLITTNGRPMKPLASSGVPDLIDGDSADLLEALLSEAGRS